MSKKKADAQQEQQQEAQGAPQLQDEVQNPVQATPCENCIALQAQIADLTDSLKRLQADFENYRKRVERDRTENARFASESILKKVLPIIDQLDLALKHSHNAEEFKTGVGLIYAGFRTTLEEEGVIPIPALGLPYDPYKHEAVERIAAPQPAKTIIEEYQKGYLFHGKVLRPARVKVSAGPEENQTHNDVSEE